MEYTTEITDDETGEIETGKVIRRIFRDRAKQEAKL
jgi:hypothetical protein